ncbi:hypothetical protein MMAGJ_59670 [Mycolicibacterium mageritense]|uniref:Uncharacterized protein n=1 Tax=Mycolicibacterium mageritense TaxID=53462 RepID=A0ABM7I1C6_MYCME|nr:hypothetical protein MMAGJ_59670 [Mycolicibacterium mageritense]GJJ23208.1 hypothetical protein MTY414_68810 [Mycolicibacterium mageritense]
MSADEIPVLCGTGGGPAWTPKVTRALSGIVGVAVGCSAALQAEAPSTAPPRTADIEAASMDRREIEAGSGES